MAPINAARGGTQCELPDRSEPKPTGTVIPNHLSLPYDPAFQKLPEETKKEVLSRMKANAAPDNPPARANYAKLATDPEFAALTPAGQKAALVALDQKPTDKAQLATAKSVGAAEVSEAKLDNFQRGAFNKTAATSGERYIDANNNGKIDANDRVLVPDGNGGFKPAPMTQSRADEINGNAGMAKAANAFEPPHAPKFPEDGDPQSSKSAYQSWLGGKSHDEGGPFKAEKYREPGSSTWYPEYKLDTSRMSGSQALDALMKDPKASTMDCAMAKQVTQYQRLRGALGDEAFDKLIAKEGMSIGYGAAADHSGALAKVSQQSNIDGSQLDKYPAGARGYANISVSDPKLAAKMAGDGWSGEHFTVRTNERGEKVVFAHPFGTTPLDKFEADMRQSLARQYGKKPEDFAITYDSPKTTDLDRARALAQ